MPPSAAPTFPAASWARALLPPCELPNSSLSKSSAERPPQWTVTRGQDARGCGHGSRGPGLPCPCRSRREAEWSLRWPRSYRLRRGPRASAAHRSQVPFPSRAGPAGPWGSRLGPRGYHGHDDRWSALLKRRRVYHKSIHRRHRNLLNGAAMQLRDPTCNLRRNRPLCLRAICISFGRFASCVLLLGCGTPHA